MIFDYKAINDTGSQSKGTIDALNKEVAISSLQRRGFIILDITEQGQKTGLFSNIQFFDRVKPNSSSVTEPSCAWRGILANSTRRATAEAASSQPASHWVTSAARLYGQFVRLMPARWADEPSLWCRAAVVIATP